MDELCECQTCFFSVIDGEPYCDSCGRLVTAYKAIRTASINKFPSNLITFAAASRKHRAPALEEPHSYRYSPLSEKGEIRLMVLNPGKWHDELHCTLAKADLNDLPRFDAASYTWADERGCKDKLARIWCGDYDEKQLAMIPITANCAALLRRLRLRAVKRLLWVDAICINQSCTRERSHQVRQMARIYSGAAGVMVFLGEEDTGDRIGELFDDFGGNTLSAPDSRMTTETYKDALARLMRRPWFGRMWVIQELLLAPRGVWICGNKAIDLGRLERMGMKLGHGLPPFLELKRTPREKWSLWSLLQMTRGCRAEDPRDRVYALLGLVPDVVEAKLVPDYSKSVHQVYTDTAAFLVDSYRSPNVLFLRDAPRLEPERASWVPDFKSEELVDDFRDLYPHKTSGIWGTMASVSPNPQRMTHPRLNVLGASVGVVESVRRESSPSETTYPSVPLPEDMSFDEVVNTFDWLICLQGRRHTPSRLSVLLPRSLNSFIRAACSAVHFSSRSLLLILARCLHYRCTQHSATKSGFILPGFFEHFSPPIRTRQDLQDGGDAEIFQMLVAACEKDQEIVLTYERSENLGSWADYSSPVCYEETCLHLKRKWWDESRGDATCNPSRALICAGTWPLWRKNVHRILQKLSPGLSEALLPLLPSQCDECQHLALRFERRCDWELRKMAVGRRQRRVFRTSDSVGIGPLGCRPQDVVFSVLEGNYLAVLRPVGDAYRYVGPCWLLDTRPIEPQEHLVKRQEEGSITKFRGTKGCSRRSEEIEFQEISIC